MMSKTEADMWAAILALTVRVEALEAIALDHFVDVTEMVDDDDDHPSLTAQERNSSLT